jgi:CDP-diacylglycerol---glycerol-3-phosphate 3-phosphatidyltransferase
LPSPFVFETTSVRNDASAYTLRSRMKRLWEAIQRGYLRVIAPIADWMVRRRINPNSITTVGTLCSVIAGGIYASGHIMTAGWVLGLTALFDVLDGTVARRTGRSTVFGAFYDSTLDRVADGAVLGGLTVFFARNEVYHSVPNWTATPMVAVLVLGIIGTFLTSYTRARAESLGIDAKVGMLQRPERVTLLSAPQAFFGLALNGWVLITICVLLSVTAWITAVQRIVFVYRVTTAADARSADPLAGAASRSGSAESPPAAAAGTLPR